MTDQLGQPTPGQPGQPPVPSQQPVVNIVTDQRRSGGKAKRAGGAVIRAIIWIIVIIVVIILALFVSAWIAGFASVLGIPVPFSEGGHGDMIEWIRNAR